MRELAIVIDNGIRVESEMNYNYIYICNQDNNALRPNPDGYYTICTKDLEKLDNVQMVTYPLDYACKSIRFLFALHNSQKINKIIKLPLKNLWYPFYFINHFDNSKPLCFIFANLRLPLDYFYYLKDKYPDAKFVKIHRDLISNFNMWFPHFTPEVISELFDMTATFDEGDSKKYNYPWFSEFESLLDDLKPSHNAGIYDVFFAGVAKDRLPKLMSAYKKLTSAGLKVHYYLVGVPNDQRISYEGIVYGDRFLSYREMLQRSLDAKCLLEINQGNCVGYTSRFLEAVMYNKLLITDNFAVKKHSLYNPEYIQCIHTADEIDISILKQDLCRVDYHYNGEFSPIHMIETIDNELTKRFL